MYYAVMIMKKKQLYMNQCENIYLYVNQWENIQKSATSL